MFDQQTKQRFEQNFDQIKTQVTQTFPGVTVSDIEQFRTDPDQFCTIVSQKTGTPVDQVEQQIKQIV